MFKRKKSSQYGKTLADKHRLRGPGGAIIIYPDYESFVAAMQFSPARRAEVGIPAEDEWAFADADDALSRLGFTGTVLATGPVTAQEFMGWKAGGWSYPRKVTAIVTESMFLAWWFTPTNAMAYHAGLHYDMRPPFASDPGELAWTTAMCHDGIQDFRVENMGLLLDTDSNLQDGQAVRRGEEVKRPPHKSCPHIFAQTQTRRFSRNGRSKGHSCRRWNHHQQPIQCRCPISITATPSRPSDRLSAV
jgi:hypothetical protein